MLPEGPIFSLLEVFPSSNLRTSEVHFIQRNNERKSFLAGKHSWKIIIPKPLPFEATSPKMVSIAQAWEGTKWLSLLIIARLTVKPVTAGCVKGLVTARFPSSHTCEKLITREAFDFPLWECRKSAYRKAKHTQHPEGATKLLTKKKNRQDMEFVIKVSSTRGRLKERLLWHHSF